ncbi:MAG: Asp-tRNA(Asn)/Glu-tRNA(Gln) amidotransferase subunit GatC [Pseudomonadales bacterium]|jgi:aspartyl-tRNA(Asn)/glutamyl-tRNA(Gln) amidotransferase subunit C
MKVDTDLVKDIAQLSQLNIPEDKLESTRSDLNQILALADQMQAINTDGVEPLANPLDATQSLRKDEVTETNQRDKFQASAPLVEKGYFLVPRVVE